MSIEQEKYYSNWNDTAPTFKPISFFAHRRNKSYTNMDTSQNLTDLLTEIPRKQVYRPSAYGSVSRERYKPKITPE